MFIVCLFVVPLLAATVKSPYFVGTKFRGLTTLKNTLGECMYRGKHLNLWILNYMYYY